MRLLNKIKRLLKLRIKVRLVRTYTRKEKKRKIEPVLAQQKPVVSGLPNHVKWTDELLAYYSRPLTKSQAHTLSKKERVLRLRAQQVISYRKCKKAEETVAK